VVVLIHILSVLLIRLQWDRGIESRSRQVVCLRLLSCDVLCRQRPYDGVITGQKSAVKCVKQLTESPICEAAKFLYELENHGVCT
jgi:hypothetical protein